ncbi:MAG: SRPBCC family protein [Melioribacteraceae bacterium]|nr:SRPBCC family protein [Melioribacteraceae bacterium]
MKIYSLYQKQILDLDIDKAWEFFSSPENLKKITPDYMGFNITSGYSNVKMFAGMIISYKVKPILNIPITWVTEITHVKEKEYFVDEQRFGPYKLWHHLHRFLIEDNKLVMIDLVNYALPFGLLGRIAHKLFIRKQIEYIFDYRRKILEDLFNRTK